MSPIRIWYQSYVDYGNGKIYWDRLRAHLAQITDPVTVIDVKGITPHDSYAHPIVEFRCAREVICNAVTVEESGIRRIRNRSFPGCGSLRGTFGSCRCRSRRLKNLDLAC